MIMQQDIIHKLREAQRHLGEAARAIDGASVNIKTLLDGINASQQQKPANDEGKADDDQGS